MLYLINDKEIKKGDLKEIQANHIAVGYLTLEEFEKNIDLFGISKTVLNECMADQTHFRTGMDIYDDFSFGIINVVNVMNVYEDHDRVAFYIRKNQFFLVKLEDKDDSYREIFDTVIGRFQKNVTLEKVIYGLLERLLANGNKSTEITERKIMRMEQSLIDGRTSQDLNKEIFRLRKELSILKNYYEQLYNIGEELQENENDLFTESDLRYFKIFMDKAGRLSSNTQLLCDDLIHLRESLDAAMNYSINRVMKIFTVVTTVFLPLTLIVGWYGMNFTTMPEITWRYGYISVIILCVSVVILCMILFKRKKLL